MNRSTTTIILAVVLVALVMCVAAFFAWNGSLAADKYSYTTTWSDSFTGAESMKIIDLTGDGVDDLFIQSDSQATIYDGSGNVQQIYDLSFATSTMGDVNGDGREDLVFYESSFENLTIIYQGQVNSFNVTGMGTPARAAVVRFDSGTQIVLGDTSGNLAGVSPEGQVLWSTRLGSGEIRGMDDARVDGKLNVAVANIDGSLAVFDAQGNALWTASTGQLRRMRAYDLNGDGTSEILTGGEYGEFAIWNAADGTKAFSKGLGQAVSEIRTVEINRDPSSIEIIAGGKEGGVWALDASGRQLWTGNMSEKVTEIAGLDLTDDGVDEVVIGDENGKVAVFNSNGASATLHTYSSEIARIDVGKLNGERRVAIATLGELEVNKVEFSSIPGFRFTPLLVGLFVSVAILVAAWIIATLPPKPQMKLSIQDKSREGLEAERRMLKESIADVERLRKSGEVTGDAYLARLKQLRGDLAENEAAFKAAGYPIKVETFQCPNCGGTLELGMDKCEYCGQVILT
ncbi:MAG: PQQ-binding-like beta-propeller repeat protein [Chloroflexota bacterium]